MLRAETSARKQRGCECGGRTSRRRADDPCLHCAFHGMLLGSSRVLAGARLFACRIAAHLSTPGSWAAATLV